MTALDDLITGDLQMLAAAHDHPRAVATDRTFRGHQPVAADVTRAQVVRQCVEVAAAKHTMRPVFAHRVARATTGAAAVLMALSFRSSAREPGGGVGGELDVLATAILFFVVYLVAYGIGRRRYDRGSGAVRSAHAVPAGTPPPLAATRARVRRLDGVATGLAMVGLVSLLPMVVYFLCGNGDSDGNPPGGELVFGPYLEIVAALSLTPALLLGGAVHGARHGLPLPTWVRHLDSFRLAAIGAGLGVLAIGQVTRTAAAASTGHVPTSVVQLGLAVVVQLSILLLSAWFALWLRRRELDRVVGAPAAH